MAESIRARCRPHDDFADIHLIRLRDRLPDSPCHCLRRQCNAAKLAHLGPRYLVADGVTQLRLNNARANHRNAQDTRLSAQPIGGRANGVFTSAVDSSGWRDRMRSDGSHIDDVHTSLFLHDGQYGSDAVQDAAHIDIDHAVPFIDQSASLSGKYEQLVLEP